MSAFGMNAGDIFLVNNGSRGNILGQKLLRLKKSVNTTHIALSLGEGVFIHADKYCGVALVFFPQLINKSEGNWKVIRHVEVQGQFEELVKQSAIFHLEKTYNRGIILRENENSLFCSQFADVVFREIGINIFNRKQGEAIININNALPVDFESLLLERERWSDVSEIYIKNTEDNFIITNLERHFLMQKNLLTIARSQRLDHSALSSFTQFMKASHESLPIDFQDENLDKMLSEDIKDLNDIESNLLYDFWDAKSKSRKK